MYSQLLNISLFRSSYIYSLNWLGNKVLICLLELVILLKNTIIN